MKIFSSISNKGSSYAIKNNEAHDKTSSRIY